MGNLSFNEWYEIAKDYFIEHNDLDIKQTFITKDGFKLGYWILHQRTLKRKNALSEAQIKKLNNLNMIWEKIIKWDDWYELALRYYKEHGHINVSIDMKSKEEDLNSWLIRQRGLFKEKNIKALSTSRVKKLNDIGMIWDKLEYDWEIGFRYAEEYFHEYRQLSIIEPPCINDRYPLGPWISRQRRAKEAGKLPKEKQMRLENIGMIWDIYDDAWNRWYVLAKEYFAEYGDLSIPTKYVTKEGEKLGYWTANQRRYYKNGKLSKKQIKLLDEIYFERMQGSEHLTWNEVYELAIKYHRLHNNLEIPIVYESDNGFKLGTWISRQRSYYKDKRLNQEQIDKLNKIGMIWSGKVRNQTSFWEQAIYYYIKKVFKSATNSEHSINDIYELDIYIPSLKIAIEYDGIFGHKNYLEKDLAKNLECEKKGITLFRIREKGCPELHSTSIDYLINKPKNYMQASKELNEKLEQILINCGHPKKFDVNIKRDADEIISLLYDWRDERWNIGYQHAERYYEKFHDLKVNQTYLDENDGYRLGQWINLQRSRYHTDGQYMPLSKKQISLLEDLNMIWYAREDKWNLKYNILTKYYYKNGTINDITHSTIIDGIKIGHWLSLLRASKKRNKLSESRITQMDKLNFKWNLSDKVNWAMHRGGSYDKSVWTEHYNKAKKYFNEYKNLNIPCDYPYLGRWIIKQRRKYKNKPRNLSIEQIKLLEDIGMIWDFNKTLWINNYEKVKSYLYENGKLPSQSYQEENGIKIGKWVSYMRQCLNGNRKIELSKDQIRLLNDLGIIAFK